MWKLLPILAALFISCSHSAPSKTTAERRLDSAPKPVASVYRINATVIPESLLVRAEIEIDVQNIYRDSINLLWLATAPEKTRRETGQHCKMLTLEMNGQSVQPEAFSGDSSTALIKLPATLKPGERVAISQTIVSTMIASDQWSSLTAQGLLVRNWLPRVVPGFAQADKKMSFTDEPSDFEISITIDSGWFVVAPGELLNDKALLGAMPNNDTILTDVIHRPYQADGFTFSRLPSENGYDTYIYRKRYSRGYDFLVLKGYRLDRANRGDRKIEAYYPAELAKKWQGRLVKQSLSKSNFARYGQDLQPRDPLKLVVIGKKSFRYSSGVWLIKAN